MHGHRQNGPKHTPWPLYGTRSKARNTARRGLAHRLETRSDTAQVHHLHTRHSTYTWGCGGKENPHISLDLLLPFQLKTLLPGVLTDTAHGNGCCGLTATIHCTRGCGVVGSRGPERPASEELLSRVAPPSGGPFQQAECHAGATAPRSAGQKVCFFAIHTLT